MPKHFELTRPVADNVSTNPGDVLAAKAYLHGGQNNETGKAGDATPSSIPYKSGGTALKPPAKNTGIPSLDPDRFGNRIKPVNLLEEPKPVKPLLPAQPTPQAGPLPVRPKPYVLPDEAVSSNARLAKTLNRTTDFSGTRATCVKTQ